MTIGKSTSKTGFVGKARRMTGSIGTTKARHHGSKYIHDFTRSKVSYPTTTTTTTTTV